MAYLLDTNHCVYIKNAMHKHQEKRHVMEQSAFLRFEKAVREEQLIVVSSATLGELYYGAEKSEHQEKNYKKLAFFLRYVEVLETGQEVWRFFGKTKAQLQAKGKNISDLDLLIACTAKIYNAVLVSGDADHKVLPSDFDIENWATQ